MCIVAIPIAAMLIAASTAMSTVGSMVQAQGQASALKYEAKNTLESGYAEEGRYRDSAAQKMATQMATLAQRGVDISTASPLSLQAESARNAELDALTIRTNAINRSNALKAQASSALAGGWFSMAGNMLGGASKLASLGYLGGSGGSSGAPGTGGLEHGTGPGQV